MVEHVDFATHGQIGVITLSRPQALNALTLSMAQAIHEQLEKWQFDTTVSAVMIESQAEKIFCSGGDIRWLYEAGQYRDSSSLRQFFECEYRLNNYIHNYPKPYIALVDGLVFGGGVGIALHGSHSIAGSNFVFSMPETGIGFFPDIGASFLLAQCPGVIGNYLGLTGARVYSQDAYFCGLVKHIINSNILIEFKELLFTTDIASDPYQLVTQCILQFATISNDLGLLQKNSNHINRVFALHTIEEIVAELQTAHELLLRETYQQLLKKSPISLKVTLKQLQQARTLSLAECLKMDYCLVGNFMHGRDFYTGVRSVVINKDKSPKWQIDSIADVTDALVADYFKCMWGELNLC